MAAAHVEQTILSNIFGQMMSKSSEMEVPRVAIEAPGSPASPAFDPLSPPSLGKNASQRKRKKARQMKKNRAKWADIERSVHFLRRLVKNLKPGTDPKLLEVVAFVKERKDSLDAIQVEAHAEQQ